MIPTTYSLSSFGLLEESTPSEPLGSAEVWSLSGGGANGGWQAGVLFRLLESRQNKLPDIILGTSVGALNAIMIATSQKAVLQRLWYSLEPWMVYSKRRNVSIGINKLAHRIGITDPVHGKFKNGPLKKLLRKNILGQKTYCEVHVSAIRVGEDDEPNEYVKFQIPKGTEFTDENVDGYVDMIVASTAIPVLFEPVWIEGRMYVDGGVFHISPIMQVIRDRDVHKHIAISCQPYGEEPIDERPAGILQMASWTIEALTRQGFRRDWDDYKKWATGQDIDDELIFPEHDLGDSMEFHWKKTRADFVNGYNYESIRNGASPGAL